MRSAVRPPTFALRSPTPAFPAYPVAGLITGDGLKGRPFIPGRTGRLLGPFEVCLAGETLSLTWNFAASGIHSSERNANPEALVRRVATRESRAFAAMISRAPISDSILCRMGVGGRCAKVLGRRKLRGQETVGVKSVVQAEVERSRDSWR